MIYKNDLLLVHIQEISSGNGSHAFSPFIDNRESTVTVLDHNILNIISEILRAESNQIIFFHHVIYRNTLVDHSGNRVSVIWGCNNNDLPLMCFLNYLLTYLDIHSHNNAAYVHLNCF